MENGIYDSFARRKYLNEKEGNRFKKDCKNLTTVKRLFCQVIYYTGCRISEALELDQERIEEADKVLRIRTLKQKKKEVYRRARVPCWLIKELLKLAKESNEKRLFPFSRTTGWRTVKIVMKEAKISGLQATTKGLRHAFGVRSRMKGMPTEVIQKLMGHSRKETTAIYLEMEDEEIEFFVRKTW